MKQALLLLSFIFFAQCLPYQNAISKGTPIPKPTYWKHLGRANPGQRFPLFYALKQKNIDKIEEIALEVSDPDHPKYGKHLSLEEVSEIVSPDEGSITQLISWLDSKGVREVALSGSKSFLKVEVSIQKAEELLGCNFQNFEFAQTEGEVISRCLTEYYVPKELDSIVEFVAPVHGFPSKTLRSHRNKLFENGKLTQSVPLSNVTADQVLTRYNVTKKLDLKVNNTQAVYEFGMSYLLSDLKLFFQTYLPYLEGQTVVKFLGNESNDPNNEGDEASLDIQLLMGVGQYAPSYSYTYGGTDLFYSFYQWAFDLDSDPKPPLTHSNSWGPTGGGYPIPEIVKASNELAKLAARGLTILIASGDDGPGCYPPAPFEVAYPTTPWVTLVGSTELQSTGPTTLTEAASNFSSGGFSNYWTRPKWQGAPVDNYLRNTPNLPTSEWYNASKRAFPDISAVGENIWIFSEGSAELVSGTSASAPIVAGIFSQLNGIRLRAGKSPLGYLNPLLYKLVTTNPELFFDVTVGSDDQGIDGCPYWPATKGWDPVTGVGTPNFKTWAKFVLTLP